MGKPRGKRGKGKGGAGDLQGFFQPFCSVWPTCATCSPILPLRKQKESRKGFHLPLTIMSPCVPTQSWTRDQKSVLLTPAEQWHRSRQGRINSAVYKCLVLMKNSPPRSESIVQLPVPITSSCPRASLELCSLLSVLWMYIRTLTPWLPGLSHGFFNTLKPKIPFQDTDKL